MGVLDSILGAQSGPAIQQLGSQFGLKPEQAAAAVGALMPALAAGLQRNLSSETGRSGLISALSGGRHEQYVDNPTALADPATTADGNAILGHVLGSKEESRAVAASAAQRTGIDANILKKMLPLVAGLAMGGLSRKTKMGGIGALGAAGAAAGLTSLLSGFMDRDGDGSMVDDAVGMLGGALRGKKS